MLPSSVQKGPWAPGRGTQAALQEVDARSEGAGHRWLWPGLESQRMSEEVTWPFGDQGSGRGWEPHVERLP